MFDQLVGDGLSRRDAVGWRKGSSEQELNHLNKEKKEVSVEHCDKFTTVNTNNANRQNCHTQQMSEPQYPMNTRSR